MKGLSSSTLGSLAAAALLVTFWLLTITNAPGTQFLAAIGAGISARATVYLILAAAQADARERFVSDLRRSGVDR